MKRTIVIFSLMLLGFNLSVFKASAQDPVTEAIKQGVTKVIKAIDLKIQRIQNNTIWLQNAQKTIENTMAKLKLDEITGWVEKHRDLYKDYFEELSKVKTIIAYYHRIKDLSEKQVQLVAEYKNAWSLFKEDGHFSPDELDYMERVYTGILEESAKNIDEIFLVINSFQTTMTDASRLEIIQKASDKTDENYYDLLRFNQENRMLSLQRAKDKNDVEAVSKLYGIQ